MSILKFEILYKNHPSTHHLKYKKIPCGRCNNSIMANRFLSSNFEQLLRRIKSALTR